MRRKVVVAMSGGVDSSVAAALLKENGYEVIGITLKLFADKISCCGDRYVKFDYLLNFANGLGADFLATGHYAIVEKTREGEFALLRGRDLNKEQSYFLYPLKRKDLSRIIFPLGRFEKKRTREIANKLNLPCRKVTESRDICFVGNLKYGRYISRDIPSQKGRILDAGGSFLGYHGGFFNFTIGQRRGIGVASKKRLYVINIKAAENIVVLGEHKYAFFSRISLKNLNWLIKNHPLEGDNLLAQIRYRHKPSECKIIQSGKKMLIEFKTPQFAPAKGQSVVFYKNDRVLGGGIIEDVGRGK